MPLPSPHAPDGRYTRVAIGLHWLVAGLLLVNVALGLGAESLPDARIRLAIDTHKSIGITVLGLAVVRVLWRLGHPPPPVPADYRPWERGLSTLVHWALYGLLFALPLSGWLHDSAWKDAPSHPMRLFGLVPWPRIGAVVALPPGPKERLHDVFGQWHAWFGYALYALVLLHVAGALKHQFVDRHRELERMGL